MYGPKCQKGTKISVDKIYIDKLEIRRKVWFIDLKGRNDMGDWGVDGRLYL
jgi:hypothetical protein